MAGIWTINLAILIGAALILAGILSSLVSMRFGAPLLLVFLALGMLAGEDGPGGLPFEDYSLTYLIGSVALAVILFDGGLRTRLSMFRAALWPSMLLATVGVVITGGIVALVAVPALGLGATESALIGAIVASTDAAAVFFLLHSGGLRLKERVGAVIEIESGTNDPVAVFLTIVLVEVLLSKEGPGIGIAFTLLHQATVGGVVGLGAGWALSSAINRLALPQGLHPLFVASGAVATYGLAAVGDGSGFLAVYLAGLILGNRPLRAYSAVRSFHDAATWLCQITMFVVLGLLVTPSRMVEYALPAAVVALTLIVLARPVAVAACLLPFRFSWRETAYVSWVGLRGAVGIFLASIPVLAGLPHAELYFNVAFFVVLVSLLLQGWTIAPSARWLRVALPGAEAEAHRVEIDLPGQLSREIVGYPVTSGCPVLKGTPIPDWATLLLVIRDGAVLRYGEFAGLLPGDHAYLLAPPERAPDLDRAFATPPESSAAASEFYGPFAINGDARLGDVARSYGQAVAPEQAERTLAAHFADEINRHPVVGDRVAVGDLELVVRAVEGDRVTQVGLVLPGRA